MIPHPRAPRVRRSTLLLVVAIAALAFPLGVLANHQFGDVPTAASYHDDVEALVDAGVTSGCGGGNYCPSQAVTRAQMAQFLNRLGDLDGDSAPSVNADAVDDRDANELTRAAYASSSNLLNGDSVTSGSLTTTITAPGPGWLLIDSHAEIYNEETADSFDTVHCQLEVGNVVVPGSGVNIDTQYTGSGAVDADEQECSPSGGFEVCGGSQSVELAISGLTQATNVFNATVTAQFIPFNGAGDPKSIFGCIIIIPLDNHPEVPAKE